MFSDPLLLSLHPKSIYTVCAPTLKILDEVQQSNPVNPLEDCCDPGKMHSFQGPAVAVEESNKYSQIG